MQVNLTDPWINQNILIRISTNKYKVNRLSSANMLRNEIGEELRNRLLKRFLSSGENRYTRKMRRGIRIDFLAK